MLNDSGEHPSSNISKWAISVPLGSPEPEGPKPLGSPIYRVTQGSPNLLLHPGQPIQSPVYMYNVDQTLLQGLDRVLGFAYHAIGESERLRSSEGVRISRNDVQARITAFVKVQAAVEEEAKKKLAAAEAKAQEAQERRRERKRHRATSTDRNHQRLMGECFRFVDFKRFTKATTIPEVSRNVVTVLPAAVEDQATSEFATQLMQAPMRCLRSGATPAKQADIAKRQTEAARKKAERAQKRKAKKT